MERTDKMCSFLMDYLLGELDDNRSMEYQNHLLTCTTCRIEYMHLHPVQMEVSSEKALASSDFLLTIKKSEILNHAFSVRQPRSRISIHPSLTLWVKNLFKKRRNFLILSSSVIACMIFSILYVGNSIDINTKSNIIQISLHNELKLIPTAAYSNSKGTARVTNDSNRSNLIVNISNVPIQSDFGCYEVWGIKQGKRFSLSEFVVNQNGVGETTILLQPTVNFDRIEITLEPTWGDKIPKGPSVLQGPLVSL